jgi:5-methylcytosine-specific restriction endonuclease McrA
MPIRTEMRALYHPEWKQIRQRILERAGHCCEGTPVFPECRRPNYGSTGNGGIVVLTVAHLDHDPANNEDTNLRALCQRCHLAYDQDRHIAVRKQKTDRKDGQFRLIGEWY